MNIKHIYVRIFLGVVLAIGSLFTLETKVVKASGFYCPSWYECARLDEVVSGKANCPEGYDCHPVLEVPDCPHGYVCFIKTKKDTPPPQDTLNPLNFSVFISSIEPFSIYPGYEVSIKGQNLKASSSIMIMKNSSLMTKLEQNSIKSESAGTYTIKFTIPTYFTPGPYSLYLETPDGTKSNTVSFYVTSVVPTSSTPGTTPVSTPTPTTSSGNTTPASDGNQTYIDPTTNTNSNYYNYYTNTYTNTNTSNTDSASNSNTTNTGGKFALNSAVQTTSSLRVRSSPSLSGTLLTTQPLGARGVVRGGPRTADGYTWWNIDYSTGIDGWSADMYLNSDVTGGNNDQCFTFSKDMSLGSSISDILYLQVAFISEGFFIADAEKRPNPYFGNTTLSAAQGYQVKYGITPQAGFVGPKTRANLNLKYGCR